MPDSKKLRLAEGQSLNLDIDAVYLVTEEYENNDVVYAVSLDENGDAVTTPENNNFWYDEDGELLFDEDSILLELEED